MKGTILALEQSALARWSGGDRWGWAELAADNLIYIDPGLCRPVNGLAEYQAYLLRSDRTIPFEGSGLIEPECVIVGDAAVLSYHYCTSTDPLQGGDCQALWNVSQVYFRQAGEWKVVHSHWAYLKHHLPEQVEVPLPVQMAPVSYKGVPGELMALEAGAMERWRKGDPWGFIEISAPEVTYFDTGTLQRLNGRESLREEYARREGKIFFDVMDFIDPQVRVCGSMAVLVYRFLSTCLNPDGSVKSRIPWNCTEVFVQQDGEWRILHTHWSLIRGERDEP